MKLKFYIALIYVPFFLFSQNTQTDKTKPFFRATSHPVKIIPPLAGRILIMNDGTKKEYRDKPWVNFPTNFNALPKGGDPLLEQSNRHYKVPGNPPIQNFVGATVNQGSGFPPDPTGAVGPNHYVHSYNTGFVIFDKEGNVLLPHNSLTNIFPGESLGDPIVMYDRYVDRFVITQFSNTPNALLVAVSQGPDPVNDSWATYRFDLDAFPDYPKYSIWHDAYYVTANKFQGNVVYAMERDEMVAGAATAEIVGFNLPGLIPNPTTVFSPLPMNSIGPNLPDASTPGYITYLQDDAWNGVTQDHIKIWEVELDWTNPNNSTISVPFQLNTTPFDSFIANFGTGEVPQPGTTDLLDGQSGIISYMTNYWAFDDRNAVTLNFNVDVSPDNSRLGIRWYELRDTNGNWSIEQEGTYAPLTDDIYRFMGSMAMDKFGNIGLAYSRGDAFNFTSLYFTGRFANDPPGVMTIDEELIAQSTGSQNLRRYGDYAQLTLDPLNDKTFWFTSEYFFTNGGWRTRVASFQIAPITNNDVGVVAITQPQDATLSNAETVTITVFNFGQFTQANIPVSISINGTVIANEIFPGPVRPSESGEYTFTATLDLSTPGQTYTLEATTNLAGDEDTTNDPFTKQVTHIDPNDIGITDITAPISNSGLGNETITVEVTNFGGEAKSNFDVSYSINNGTPVTETVPATVDVGEKITYSFTNPGNFSANGIYDLEARTLLNNDANPDNDAFSKVVRNIDCIPAAVPVGTEQGCNLDGIKRFVLGTIDVDNGGNGCNTEGGSGVLGYSDRTHLSTDLNRAAAITLVRVQQNWADGVNGPEQFSLWIDFNDNSIFEPSEQLISGATFTVANTLQTFTFNVPNDANLGSHILRARVIDTSSTPGDINDPCADYRFGETHDYTVNITDSTLTMEEFFLNDAVMTIATLPDNEFRVELPTTQITETLVITLHNALGQKLVMNRVDNENGAYVYNLTLDGLSPGVYLVRLGTSKFGKVKRIIVK